MVLFKKTAMQLRSQRPLHVQGDAGHPDSKGWWTKKPTWIWMSEDIKGTRLLGVYICKIKILLGKEFWILVDVLVTLPLNHRGPLGQ
jgi:hypothetical protein